MSSLLLLPAEEAGGSFDLRAVCGARPLTSSIVRIPESRVDRIAARWIELLDCEGREIDPEEKPMLRELTGDLIDFCRLAEGAEDVLFARSL